MLVWLMTFLLTSTTLAKHEAILTFHKTKFRIQSLSATLIRVEREGLLGFVDNNTNLVVNRKIFKGVPLTIVSSNASMAVLSTQYYTIQLVSHSLAQLVSSSLTSSGSCRETHTYQNYTLVDYTMSKDYKGGVANQTYESCCVLCDDHAQIKNQSDCTAFIYKPDTKYCYPVSRYQWIKPQKGEVIGIQKIPPPIPPSVQMTILVNGTNVWNGDVPDNVPYQLELPSPADVYNDPKYRAWAVRDGPLFIPPTWGATPPPSDVDLGPLTNTSGFDTRIHTGADAYVFLIPGAGSASSAAKAGYISFRSEFLSLTGPVPLLPDWAWGLWFTWFHPYNQTEKIAEIKRFQTDKIPLDVASLDMNWRNTTIDYKYAVDTQLFPDMKGLIQWVHDQNMKFFFNDHPAPFGWEKSPGPVKRVAAQMSPEEVKFRYNGLSSMLDIGLDFWWFDCHWQFSVAPVALGNDELSYRVWGERVYWDVMTRYNKEKRPDQKRTIMLGCYDSPHSHPAKHRTPVWWTGDIQHTALDQAIYDEINGGLQMLPYVHPDCTGHHDRDEEDKGAPYPPEVYARWVQFCSMGTIFRIHSAPKDERQPWTLGKHVEDIMRNFTQMRYKLIPTLVAAGAKATETGLPLVRRLDLEWPDLKDATRMDQYLLADDLLVAPVDPWINVKDPVHGPFNRKRNVSLPPGEWIDAFTGKTYKGATTIKTKSPLESMPLFHRGGSMIITLTNSGNPLTIADLDWSNCVLDVFPFVATTTATAISRKDPITIVRTTYEQIPAQAQSWKTRVTKTEYNDGRIILQIGQPSLWSDSGHHIESISALAIPSRTWTIRLHLHRNSKMNVVTLVDDSPTSSRILGPRQSYAMPFGGPGALAAPLEGGIVEISLEDIKSPTKCEFILS